MSTENKILFITDFYTPNASANSICIMHLQDELLSRGIKSDVLCYGFFNGKVEDNQYGSVYSIKNSLKISRDPVTDPIKFPEKLKNGIIWPIKSVGNILRLKKMIKLLDSQNTYLTYVAGMKPIESPMSVLKKKSFIVYELDSITNNGDNLKGIKKYIKYRASNLERIIYSKCALVIHMASHEAHYEQSKYNKLRQKFFLADIPGLLCNKDIPMISSKNDKIIISYTGTLHKDIRSPKYSLRLLSALSQKMPLVANFYSKGDCENMFAELGNDSIIQKGYVSPNEVNNILYQSDFLWNIGNTFSGKVTSLPSKTIEYIATGKPIIHIDGGENDTAKDYIRKCENTIIIDPDNDFDNNMNKLTIFIEQNKGKSADIDKIRCLFTRNTPEYTVNKILEMCQNGVN